MTADVLQPQEALAGIVLLLVGVVLALGGVVLAGNPSSVSVAPLPLYVALGFAFVGAMVAALGYGDIVPPSQMPPVYP